MSDISRDYSFGGILRYERVKKRFTLRMCAEYTGLSSTEYSKMERSQIPPPDTEQKVYDLCLALQIADHAPFLTDLAYSFHQGILWNKFWKVK